ncbi:BMA-FECL-1 [Dirofilaria immitis]|nr:BMA-FECL-1 [Dirofilaria immitis]
MTLVQHITGTPNFMTRPTQWRAIKSEMSRWPLSRNLLPIRYIESVKANSSNSNVFGSISAVDVSLKTAQHETTKTAVLMLHHGQPRTPYYAAKHLAEGSHYYYKLPLWLTSRVTRLYWPLAKKVDFCVDDYKYSENFSYLINTYSKMLQGHLNELVPEYKSFYCIYAFLYEEPTILRVINDLIRQGVQRLILLPLYPHYSCFQTGTMLNVAVKVLDQQTEPLLKDGISSMNYRVRTMSHISFRCSAIDRWSNHPAVINFWYDLIYAELRDHDSLLFVAPQMRGYNSSGYIREVWTTCLRLMEHLNEALYFLRREKRYRTLVVPIASLMPCFESETLLPNILQNEGVNLLSPPGFSPVLAHGFAELIKNHLMGRRASSQLSCRCKFCFSSHCILREAMLAPEEISSNEFLKCSIYSISTGMLRSCRCMKFAEDNRNMEKQAVPFIKTF